MSSSQMKRVAFIQNRVQRGGRFQVTVEMLKVFNEMGIVPDFYTYRVRLNQEEIVKHYGANVEVNFKTISEPFMPFEWNIVLFNRQVNKYLSNYDLVVNSNNTSFGLRPDLNVLSYVHFPRKYRMRSPLKSIHFDKVKKSIFDLGNDPFKVFSFLYKFDKTIAKNDLQVANSKFTADALKQSYGVSADGIIYPPVDVKCVQPEKDSSKLVSLGRFSPDKRQLEQIHMMAKLPSHHLYLIGFKNDVKYFAKCEAAISELGLSNVTLMPNASHEDRDKVLQSAKYFIHTLRNEPFGITTVQGIAAGCIPVVHNSGGQKEVVPYAELRFDSESQIPQLIVELEKSDGGDKRIAELQQHIESYGSEHFRSAFKAVAMDKLNLS